MFFVDSKTRVYIATGATDMRKSINGLSILVAEQLELDPMAGHLFCFCNRKRDMVKILYWQRNGFCLWHKRLEKHLFQWPESVSDVMAVEVHALRWLLDGLSLMQAGAHGELSYLSVV